LAIPFLSASAAAQTGGRTIITPEGKPVASEKAEGQAHCPL
jgi:hypothetical protein